MEEALSLWVAVVENSTSVSPQLIALCKNIMPIIEMSSENLRTVLTLIQAYIILDAHAYLDIYGAQFVAFCLRMFPDIRVEGIILMLKVFETCLKTDPNYALELLRPSLPYIFKQVYLNKEYPMLMGMYLTILARVLIINQNVFTEVVNELQLPNALETILDVWIVKMPLSGEVTEKRKLFSLALGSIFSNSPLILERFAHIMQNISETLMDVMREDDENVTGELEETINEAQGDVERKPIKYVDSLVFQDEHDLDTSSYCTMDDFDYKTYHYDRCRQLSLKDPVHKVILTDYLTWQLNSLRTQMGEPAFQNLMKTVDPGVLEKLNMFMQLNLAFEPN